LNDLNVYISFNGLISADNTLIEGTVRYYLTNDDPNLGTFLLSKS
jgi:hypothetical protein